MVFVNVEQEKKLEAESNEFARDPIDEKKLYEDVSGWRQRDKDTGIGEVPKIDDRDYLVALRNDENLKEKGNDFGRTMTSERLKKLTPDRIVRRLKSDEFSLSDAGARKHDQLMKELGTKREIGVPLEDLRREFVSGMSDFTAKRNPGEDMGEYMKRANSENKIIEQEADYLSKKMALRK